MKKISIMLLFALLIGLFISCGGNEAKSDIPNGTNNDETETEAKKVIDIEYIDLEGYEIRFVVRGEGSGNFQCIDLYSESMNGDKINDAVYERNSYLEEMYNFKIKMTGVAVNVASIADSPATVAKTSILSQEDLFDVVYDSFHQTNSLLQEKMLVDLYTLPYINFSKPYWDADVNADLSINNKLYTTHGEHMLSVSAGLYCTFFNKEMAEDLNLEDLYNIVRNNKWTMEKYYSLAKDVSYDIDGNGALDFDDAWGLVTESFNALTFFAGSGEKITTKDNNDLPILSMNTSRAESVLTLSNEFLTDKNTTILFDNFGSDKWPLLTKIWEDGRALFFLGPLMQTPTFRSMDTDFGILPAPKYEESQSRYYHIVSIWNASLLVVPVTITEPEKIGYILELLAAKSVDTLTPAFYDVQLTNKFIRDNESKEMIDIILASASFDLGSAYNFGGLFNAVLNIGAKTAKFASTYASAESSAQAAIEKFIEAVS